MKLGCSAVIPVLHNPRDSLVRAVPPPPQGTRQKLEHANQPEVGLPHLSGDSVTNPRVAMLRFLTTLESDQHNKANVFQAMVFLVIQALPFLHLENVNKGIPVVSGCRSPAPTNIGTAYASKPEADDC